MFSRNSTFLGILIGACLPLLTVALVEWLKVEEKAGMRESTLYMVCIGLNALLFRQSFRAGSERTARGILLLTFIYALLFYIYKF